MLRFGFNMVKIFKFSQIKDSPFATKKGFDKLVEYVLRNDVFKMPLGKYEIDGKNLFFEISNCNLRAKQNAPLEAHKKYADLQLILDGAETFGLSDTNVCRSVKTPYNLEKDIEFFEDAPEQYKTLSAGEFMVFFPENAHAPLIGEGSVKKVVFKILL